MPKKTSDKRSIKKESEFQFSPPESESFGGDIATLKEEVTPFEVKVGQLEIKLETLEERLKSERSLKFWIIGTVLAIIAGIFGAFTIYLNLIKDSQDTYSDLQKVYFQELLNLRKEFKDSNVNNLTDVSSKQNNEKLIDDNLCPH